MAIGYEKARNLMRQLDWKMRVSTLGDSVEKIVLFHPCQQQEHTVRIESGRKLIQECILSQRLDSMTVILEYNRVEEEMDRTRWFAIVRWCADDVIAVAKERGIHLTEEQATEWLKRNGRWFREMLVEHGNEILSDADFGDVKEADENQEAR